MKSTLSSRGTASQLRCITDGLKQGTVRAAHLQTDIQNQVKLELELQQGRLEVRTNWRKQPFPG